MEVELPPTTKKRRAETEVPLYVYVVIQIEPPCDILQIDIPELREVGCQTEDVWGIYTTPEAAIERASQVYLSYLRERMYESDVVVFQTPLNAPIEEGIVNERAIFSAFVEFVVQNPHQYAQYRRYREE